MAYVYLQISRLAFLTQSRADSPILIGSTRQIHSDAHVEMESPLFVKESQWSCKGSFSTSMLMSQSELT